jgi:predicted  nucleic acid-binding Zn-ribbon protein
MFPFLNKDFFKSMLDGQRELEMKAPNGAVYRFSTNAIDEKTFDSYRKKLEEAAKNNDQNTFDQTWNEFTAKNGLTQNIETEMKKFHDDVQQFFQETSPFFNKNNFSLLNDPFFSEPKSLSEEAINKQIEHHQQKIEELQNKKNNMDTEKRKLQLKEEIKNKKNSIDVKLDEFAKNLDNDEMKKKLTEEMTNLNAEIKQLENELQQLS